MPKGSGFGFGGNAFMDAFLKARQSSATSSLTEAKARALQQAMETQNRVRVGISRAGARIGSGYDPEGGNTAVQRTGGANMPSQGQPGAPGSGPSTVSQPMQPYMNSPVDVSGYGQSGADPSAASQYMGQGTMPPQWQPQGHPWQGMQQRFQQGGMQPGGGQGGQTPGGQNQPFPPNPPQPGNPYAGTGAMGSGTQESAMLSQLLHYLMRSRQGQPGQGQSMPQQQPQQQGGFGSIDGLYGVGP